MKFKVVEGKYDVSDGIDLESLAKDYSDPTVTVEDMCKKHDISTKKYYKLHPKLVEMTGLKRKASDKKGGYYIQRMTRHITFDKHLKKYRIGKFIGGKLKRFGHYDTLEEAIEVRDELIEHEWDVEYFVKEIMARW